MIDTTRTLALAPVVELAKAQSQQFADHLSGLCII
jgi:hypothetical protein